MTNAERLIGILAPVFGEGDTDVDKAVIDRLAVAAEPIIAEDFVVVMSGTEFVETTYEGIGGLRSAWHDWLESFARVRLEIEGVEEVGENVLTLARQVGVSRHGVEIEQPSAAVWKFRDGRVTRLEFHLDRDRATRSAQSAQE